MAVKILNGVDVVGNMNITASDVPNLDANKITSGTIGSARIPNLAASKITSGTLGTARIPNLDAGKITSGTFHSDRMPDLSSTYAAASHNHDDRYLRLGGGVIVHSSGTHGLEIYTNSAIPTTEQFKVGRDSAQYYGIRVDDGTARLIHRQDESGTGTHNITSEIWTSTSGGGTWTWRLRDREGVFRRDEMSLSNDGLTVYGKVIGDELNVSQHVKATGNNLSFSAGGNQILNIDLNGKIYPQTHNANDLGFNRGLGFRDVYATGLRVGTASTISEHNTTGAIRINSLHGHVSIGAENTSWAHFNTDRAAFYFGKRAEIAGEFVPYQANQHNLGTSSKPWIRIYGTTIYQGSDRVLATQGDVHSALYNTGGNADTYDSFGIYRNYGEGQPTGLGHNTVLNVVQRDGNYGWQITSSTANGGDSMWYRQKGTTFGDGTWHQIASRSWVTSQGYGDATQAWVQAQGYITSETDSQTLSWGSGNGQLTISNGNTVDLDGRYMYGAVGNGGDFNDLTGGKNSNFVAFNASNITDAPDTSWYNGLVTTHSNYLSSYIVNKHRTNDWYLSWRDANITPSANWSRIWHDRDFSSTDVTNWNTAYGWGNHASAGYLTSVPSEYLTQTEGDARYLGITAKAADSNLLDGIDSTGFVKQLSDGDNPNYQTPSSRRVNPNGDNPTNEHYAITTFGNGGNVTGQLATHFVTGKLFSRGYNNTWSQWKAYATEEYAATAAQGAKADTAHGWGNHASAGYLTSYTETDTLASVTGRGAVTSTQIGIGGGAWTPLTISLPSNEGNPNAGVAIAFDGTDYEEYGYRFKANGSNYYQVLYDGSNINWKHYSNGSYNTKMSLSNAGRLVLNSGALFNGANDNSGKADFAVGTGGYGAVSLRSNQVQIGGDDMNYTGRFDATSTYVSIRGWDRDLLFLTNGSSSAANMQHIKFSTKPSNGGATERVRIDGTGYTYFHGLDLAISNVNSDHGKGNYFRGSSTHLVIGTGGTLHLNMSGSTTVMHGENWYSGRGDRQTNLGQLNTRFENIHAKQIGSQDAGLFFEDTDNYRCIRPAHMGTGDADGTISLGYSNYRWATIYGNNLDVTSNVKVQGSVYTDNANYSIDLRDHGGRTWLRNAVGGWTFQAGTSGDDWTQSFSMYLPAAGTNVNNVYVQLGQRDSNDVTGGRYRGVRIVRDGGASGIVDGDLIVGRLDVTSNTYFGNDIMIDDNNGTSPSLMFRSGDDTIFQFYKEDNNNTLTITRQDNGGADFRFVADPADYSQSRLQIGTGYIDVNKINSWDAAYGWGNHANAGYLTGSHTHSAADITSGTLNGARLPWASGNDGFTGTYGIVWRAGDQPWTASWLTVNGQTDTLNTRNIDATGNITIDGVLKSYRSDTNTILQSYNKSATGSPAQFHIRHNYGNVDIANTRGNIYFETRTDFETVVVAQTDLYVGNSIQHWGDGGTGMYFNTDQIDFRTQGVKRMISAGTDGRTYFGSNTNKGYLREFPSNTYGSQIGRIARITFTGGFSDWDSDAHCIVSKDINGSMADSLSINSYNDITVRLDSNNNNGTSHFYITNNTYGSEMNNRLLDMNTGTNETEIATAFIPYTDRLQTLGRDDRRWQIVFCETLDSAGQHESNLQDEEQPISQYKTGTVLSWKDGKNRPCTQYADHMRMGIAVHGQESPLIQGAEPVLCTGIVEEGDYLVTSDKEGHAVAVPRNIVKEQMLFDCVIGKALENGDGESHLIKTWINI